MSIERVRRWAVRLGTVLALFSVLFGLSADAAKPLQTFLEDLVSKPTVAALGLLAVLSWLFGYWRNIRQLLGMPDDAWIAETIRGWIENDNAVAFQRQPPGSQTAFAMLAMNLRRSEALGLQPSGFMFDISKQRGADTIRLRIVVGLDEATRLAVSLLRPRDRGRALAAVKTAVAQTGTAYTGLDDQLDGITLSRTVWADGLPEKQQFHEELLALRSAQVVLVESIREHFLMAPTGPAQPGQQAGIPPFPVGEDGAAYEPLAHPESKVEATNGQAPPPEVPAVIPPD